MRVNKQVLSLLIVALLAITAKSQEPPPLRMKTFDLGFLRATIKTQVSSSHELPLRASLGSQDSEDYKRESFGWATDNRELSTDDLVELTRQLAIKTDVEEEFSSFNLIDDSLIVRAPAATLVKIEKVLVFLEKTLLRNATIELALLDRSALEGTEAGLLNSTEINTILAKQPQAKRLNTVLNLGQSARLDASRMRQFVVDYDVEVAEKARISQPISAALFEGLQVGIQLDACLDGRFLLQFQGRTCKRIGRDRIIKAPSAGIGAIELPKTRSSTVAMSALLAPGSGFLVGSNESDNKIWLVQLKTVAPKPAFAGLDVLPTGSFDRPPFMPNLDSVVGPLRSNMVHSGIEEEEENRECVLPCEMMTDSVMEMAGNVVDEGVETFVFPLDHKLFIFLPKQYRESTIRTIASLPAPFMRNVATEYRYDLVDTAVASELLSLEPKGTASKLSRQAHTLNRTGSRSIIASGREWLSLADKQVEIAKNSQIADPVVEAVFAGIVLKTTPAITLGGDISLVLDYTFQVDTKKGRKFDTGVPEVGVLDADDLAHVSGRARMKLKENSWTLIHSAPLEGSGKTFILMARCSR